MRGSMTISTPLGPLSLLARVRHLLVAALCSAVAAATAGVALGQPAPTVAVAATAPRPIDLSRFEKDIVAFETADRAAPLPRDGILFVGSSIFRLWKDLGAHMAPLPVLNRAFGGSRTPEQLHFFDRVVLPYRPRIIVYYCGSNDVNAGETAEDIAWHYREFSERVRATLPGTRVYFASIIKAPQKRDRWDVVDRANALVQAYSATVADRGYLDINVALQDERGEPRMELYLSDQLHYLPPAYVRLAATVRPVVEQAWREMTRP
jgi:lysophospholipase L1-like esterase